jgi:surface antigen/Ni/Co efflux regulator RcnB
VKNLILGATAFTLLASSVGVAAPLPAQDLRTQADLVQLVQGGRDRDRRPTYERGYERGDRLPRELRSNRYVYHEWRQSNLPRAPQGFRWMLINNQYILAATSSGSIRDVRPVFRGRDRDWNRDRGYDRAEREARWRARYSRTYNLNDDQFYRECRNKPDPAGALVGAVIGGLLGNAAGNNRNETTTTIAGVIAGGAIGAALTSKLECEDRSYAYKTYTTGFNAGKTNAYYDWQNPRSGARGRLHVLDYYEDEDDFRCTVYSQTIYIGGRPQEARGRACQQPDGAWAIID